MVGSNRGSGLVGSCYSFFHRSVGRVGSGPVFANIIIFGIIWLITASRIGSGQLGSTYFYYNGSGRVGLSPAFCGSGRARTIDPRATIRSFVRLLILFSLIR